MVRDNIKCPICNSDNIKESIYPGYLYEGIKYKKYQCRRCSFIFIFPVPDRNTIKRIYGNPEYFNNYCVLESEECGYVNSRDTAINNAGKTLERIRRFANGYRLLEIGCAGGFFLSAAKEKGFDVTGIEINRKMAEIANQEIGSNRVIQGDILDIRIKEQSFDVAYMGDVLEHIAQFSDTIDYVRKVLTTNGILVIDGPIAYHKTLYNLFLKAKFFLRRRYYSGNAPTHLWEFAPQNLRFFLERHGFKVLHMEVWERRPAAKKIFYQSKDSSAKAISWHLKSISSAISNSWFGRMIGLGDRINIIASLEM